MSCLSPNRAVAAAGRSVPRYGAGRVPTALGHAEHDGKAESLRQHRDGSAGCGVWVGLVLTEGKLSSFEIRGWSSIHFQKFFQRRLEFPLGEPQKNPMFWPAYPKRNKPQWSLWFSTQRAMQGVQVELSWMPRFWNFIRLSFKSRGGFWWCWYGCFFGTQLPLEPQKHIELCEHSWWFWITS